MGSIYRDVLGDAEFGRLHPEIRRRFGFDSSTGVACIGRGTMDEVWHGGRFTLPFLWFGTWRRIMFPNTGRNVPFSIHNYAYRDRRGRETVTWIRKFPTFGRRFDATMIRSASRRCIVDYLGSHQHLAVDIHISVDEATRGLRLRSGEQRFYEGAVGFRFPMLFSGYADVCEWFDDADGCHRIDVNVSNPTFGPLFGYRGRFHAEWFDCGPGDVPKDVRPLREEGRE